MTPVPALTIADGAWIFVAVIAVWLLAIAYGYYTRRGSAINQRAYGKQTFGAARSPGAKIPSVLSHDQSAAQRLLRAAKRKAEHDGRQASQDRRRSGRATRSTNRRARG
jgi:hypothetical protein